MTIPSKYSSFEFPIKYYLASYRALSDGRSGILQLEDKLDNANVLLSEWKIVWIGTCTTLRTAIDLFRSDAKSCLVAGVREEIISEWNAIKSDKTAHAIFWEFLRHERDSVLHQYKWSAYEAWIKPDGTLRPRKMSLLIMKDDDGARPALMMNDGPFKGQSSLDLLKQSADWVEDRIYAAIRRAGYEPDENCRIDELIPALKLRS